MNRKALRDLPIAADLKRNQDLFEAESGFNFAKGKVLWRFADLKGSGVDQADPQRRTAVAFLRQLTELSGVVPPCSRRTNRGIQ